jgi:hypothetical protein
VKQNVYARKLNVSIQVPALIDIDAIQKRIATGYASSGNTQGWRFLYSHRTVLNDADVAIIGLNPGGGEQVAEHGEFDVPPGTSAYVHECWKDFPAGKEPLQLQIQALCRWVNIEPQKVLAGNFIPWRSRSLRALKEPDRAKAFARELWSDIFQVVQPRLVIAIGLDTGAHIAKVLQTAPATRVGIGWGNYSATIATNGKQRLIALPHLSRFRIMDRPKSRESLEKLFQPV